jgi:hypothetical protein
MGLKDRLKATMENLRVKEVALFGEKVLVRVLSIKEFKSIKNAISDTNGKVDENRVLEMLAAQFLDPSTKAPIFTTEDLQSRLPASEIKNLLELFYAHNGAVDQGQAEKNLPPTP